MVRTCCPSKKSGPRLHCSFTKPPCKILESSPPPDGRTSQLWPSNTPAEQPGGFHAKSSCFRAEQGKFQYPCICRSGAAAPLPESRLGCSISSPHWPESRNFRIPGLLIKYRNVFTYVLTKLNLIYAFSQVEFQASVMVIGLPTLLNGPWCLAK